MKRRNWILLVSAVCLAVSALRTLCGAPSSSLLRPPLSEAELGV